MAESPRATPTDDPRVPYGTWVLTLASVEPGNSATIDLIANGDGSSEPRVYEAEQTITFVYRDGRRTVYSWAHLLSGVFTPGEGYVAR